MEYKIESRKRLKTCQIEYMTVVDTFHTYHKYVMLQIVLYTIDYNLEQFLDAIKKQLHWNQQHLNKSQPSLQLSHRQHLRQLKQLLKLQQKLQPKLQLNLQQLFQDQMSTLLLYQE